MTGRTPEGRTVDARRVPWLTLFAVAFGFLEAGVVVYLRELYYPAGFRFPVVIVPDRIAVMELVRELTTVLMLLAVALLYILVELSVGVLMSSISKTQIQAFLLVVMLMMIEFSTPSATSATLSVPER